MSGDGAHLGVSASRALDSILGDEPSPEEGEGMAPDQMRDYLLSCTEEEKNSTYENCARYVGKRILELYLADPHLATVPMENQFDTEALQRDGWTHENMLRHRTAEGLYEIIQRDYPEVYEAIEPCGVTGFQWGWAVNAARYCVELPPEPNPAILEI